MHEHCIQRRFNKIELAYVVGENELGSGNIETIVFSTHSVAKKLESIWGRRQNQIHLRNTAIN